MVIRVSFGSRRASAPRHRHQTMSGDPGGITRLSTACLILPSSRESFARCPAHSYSAAMQIDELKSLIARHARPDGSTPIEGVMIAQHDAPMQEFSTTSTVMALIAQGEK